MSCSKPATSCHLWYGKELEWPDISDSWTLECSVEVEKSHDCTNFIAIGFAPGGICGLQQDENNEKRVIFSLWNKDEISVEVVDSGSNVETETFGGHGTGIKAKESLDWGENQTITFRLSAEKMEDFWYCTCKYTVGRDEDLQLLAILKRSVEGGPILQPQGFYSYIEISIVWRMPMDGLI